MAFSGGVDSSLLFAVAMRALGAKMLCCSGFEIFGHVFLVAILATTRLPRARNRRMDTVGARMPPNAGLGVSRRGKAKPSIACPMCAPGLQPTHPCRYKPHGNHAILTPRRIYAMPSQREGQGSSPLSSTILKYCCD